VKGAIVLLPISQRRDGATYRSGAYVPVYVRVRASQSKLAHMRLAKQLQIAKCVIDGHAVDVMNKCRSRRKWQNNLPVHKLINCTT